MRSLKVVGWVWASRCHWPGLSIWKTASVWPLRMRCMVRDRGRGRQVVDVGPLACRLLDEGQRLLDGAEGAQPEQVKLDEAEPLHVVFVDLQRTHTVGRDAYRQEVR